MEEIKGRTAKLISENDPQEMRQEIVGNVELDEAEEDVLVPSSSLPVNDKPNVLDIGVPDYVFTARPMIGRGWLIVGLIVFFMIVNN